MRGHGPVRCTATSQVWLQPACLPIILFDSQSWCEEKHDGGEPVDDKSPLASSSSRDVRHGAVPFLALWGTVF